VPRSVPPKKRKPKRGVRQRRGSDKGQASAILTFTGESAQKKNKESSSRRKTTKSRSQTKVLQDKLAEAQQLCEQQLVELDEERHQRAELSRELEAKVADSNRAQKKVGLLRNEKNELAQRLLRLKAERSSWTKDRQKLVSRVRQAERKSESLQQELTTATQQRDEAKAQRKRSHADCAASEEARQQLEREQGKVQGAYAAQKAKNETLSVELRRLRAQEKKERQQLDVEQANCASLRAERDQLAIANEESGESLHRAQQQVDELRMRLAQLSAQIIGEQEELRQAEVVSQELQNQCEGLRTEQDKWIDRCRRLELERHELEKEVAAVHDESQRPATQRDGTPGDVEQADEDSAEETRG